MLPPEVHRPPRSEGFLFEGVAHVLRKGGTETAGDAAKSEAKSEAKSAAKRRRSGSGPGAKRGVFRFGGRVARFGQIFGARKGKAKANTLDLNPKNVLMRVRKHVWWLFRCLRVCGLARQGCHPARQQSDLTIFRERLLFALCFAVFGGAVQRQCWRCVVCVLAKPGKDVLLSEG